MDRSLYPSNWEEIAHQIKAAANWRCEECDRPCRQPGEDPLSFCERVQTNRVSECPVVFEFLNHPGRFVLTVAHLDHRPENCDRANLRALCSVCHLRYDAQFMALKRRLKRERQGQLTLFDVGGKDA